jgi:hypothetical protein
VKKSGDESVSSDSSSLAKIEVKDSVKTEASKIITARYLTREEVTLPITEKNLHIDEGNWLLRNCFPPASYNFSTDRAFLSSHQKGNSPPRWNLKGDTLRIFINKDSAEVYKILSLTTLQMKLSPMQTDGKYLKNCGSDEDLVLDRDNIIQSISEEDLVGNWGNGEYLILRGDLTFEYSAPPSCTANGTWSIDHGKLWLIYSYDPCLEKYISNINEIEVTTYALYFKTPDKDEYREWFRQ